MSDPIEFNGGIYDNLFLSVYGLAVRSVHLAPPSCACVIATCAVEEECNVILRSGGHYQPQARPPYC